MIGKPAHVGESSQNYPIWKIFLISLVLVMTFQIIRVFITSLVYAFGERFGQTLAAVPALIVFTMPMLTGLIGTRLRPRLFLWITAGGVAVLRLLMQISRNIDLNMILAGLAIPMALMALILIFASMRTSQTIHPRHLVVAVFLGMSLDVGLHGAFMTWDYLWQPGWLPLLVTLLISGSALFAIWKVQAGLPRQQPDEHKFRDVFPVAALGAFFMLEMLFFQNPAFIASSGLVPLEVGLAVAFLGNFLAMWISAILSSQGLAVRLVSGAVLVGVAALLPHTTGTALIALVLAGQAAAGGMLSFAISGLSAAETRPGLWRTSLAVLCGSLLFVLLAILYYISTLITLPFSYTVLPLVAALLLMLTAFKLPQRVETVEWRWVTLPLALLLIPVILFLTRPTAERINLTSNDNLRFLNYNIHQAITFSGWLDPEGLAQVIEAQQPDIFVLQEISRGWLIAGGMDDAEWLSRRLNMPYVYAPGHDYQFGNIIFTRLPVADWSFTRLPLLNVPLGRGLIRANIQLGDGKNLSVINTHLSAYASDEARVPQVKKVLETWSGTAATIIAGDMNAHPEDSAIELFRSAGLVSAQDVTGHSDLMTFSSAMPDERIDWIFGTPEIAFSDFAILQTTASDHLPLLVTLRIRQ